MNKDLTIGKPQTVLIKYTLPLFVSIIFQQLYNMADSIIVGKFVGESALAAVGASYPITMIFMAVAVGSQVGCSVVISRLYGSKDYLQTKTSISTTIISGFVISTILTALGTIFSPLLINLVNTPENIFSDADLYLRIYTGGFIFLFLYNAATGIFNSLGDSRTPLIFLICSSLSNIFLDILFVSGFGWGVAGAAWATFIAQGAACVLSLIVLKKRIKFLKTEKKAKLFSLSSLKSISKVAVPSILQQSFVSVGNMFIQVLVNGFGSSVIAGYSAAIKLNTFGVTTFTTLAGGVSNFTAQNMGAVKHDRIKKGFATGLVFALSVAAVFFLLFFFFGEQLLSLFMDAQNSPLATKTGIEFLKIVSPFYFFICTKLICDGVLRGSEKMAAFMIATFTDLALRVILAFSLSGFMGTSGIWCSWPISWVIATGLSVIFYAKLAKSFNK
ncbi:MAG: MATE family efflux transporter [Clostridiales bacterium]|nr:MAG: MATE family efflux transporter [Clostridiales bacterium]